MAGIIAAQVQAADFDHVFTLTYLGVHDWSLTEPEGVYAPTVTVVNHAGDLDIDKGWETITDGMSGQYCYSGPVMHPSERIDQAIGEELMRLAEEEPVTFVAVVVGTMDDEQDAGWAIVRKTED